MHWVREACKDYEELTRGGLFPYGRMGNALKPLVQRDGWETVERAWRHFLKVIEIQFATPEYFARTYPQWKIILTVQRPAPRFREVQEGKRMVLRPEPPEAA